MTRRSSDTTVVSPQAARAHLEQAEEYLRAALGCLERGDHNAAAGTAIDAGINAADAVAGMNLGMRWRGEHEQASRFVESAGREGKEVARELRRLLPLKTQAHYTAEPVSATKARACVDAATRAVAVARRAAARITEPDADPEHP